MLAPMKKKPAKLAEKKLYAPIVDFLKRQYACDPGHLWWAGCGRDLAFAAGFGKRKPDVVGISRQNRSCEVHLVEAKLLNLRTTAFDDTLAQLDSFNPYADYLWAAFPKSSWDSEENNHAVWMVKLKKRGYGLLLVAESIEQRLQPARNQEVDRDRRKLLLDAMLGEGEKLIALPSLGPEASGAAGRAAARLAEVMAGPVKEVFGRRFKDHKFVVADVYDSATALFTLGDLEQGNLFVQGDPFGWHLQDGRPVVWVWRYDTSLSPSSESAHAKGGLLTTDTYLYAATKDNKNWICRPIADCDRASIRAEGFIEDMCVGRPLAISDRTMAGIKEQLKVLLAWAHKLPK